MALKREHAALSSDLDDPSAVPYFLWDEPMTVAELRTRLRTTSRPERTRLLAKIQALLERRAAPGQGEDHV